MSLPPEHQLLRDVPLEDPEPEIVLTSSGDLIDIREEPATRMQAIERRATTPWLVVPVSLASIATGIFLYTSGIVEAKHMQHSLKRGEYVQAVAEKHNAIGKGVVGLGMLGVGAFLNGLGKAIRREQS
jgi:hypothetical protein